MKFTWNTNSNRNSLQPMGAKKFHIWRWIHSHRIMQTIYMIWFSGSKYCFLYFRREVYCINFETIERNCCKSNTKYATITWIANEEKRGWNDGEFNWGWKLYDYRPIFFMHLSGWNFRKDIYFSYRSPSFHNCLSRECCDHLFSTEGVFPSSAVKTFVRLTCLHRFGSGPHRASFALWTLSVIRPFEDVPLLINRLSCHGFRVCWFILVDNYCNKCRQAFCSFTRARVQTSCNCEASKSPYCLFLGFNRSPCHGGLSKCSYCSWHRVCSVVIMHNHFNLLLHQNLPCTSPSFISSTKARSPRSTKWRRNSAKQSTVQRDSVHSSVGSNDLTGLLSSVWSSRSF